MCADLMMRRARLFGPLLASGCEVLISGEGTRRVRLFDGERALVGNATAKRRREFTETRLLAHEALRRIGHDGPILKGSDGEPLWPSGIVGSLSHCPSLCVAAVASAERIRAVGVDVDDSDGLSDGIMRFVFSSEELASLRMASSVERRAAFCAKEAASKALSALDGTGDFRKVSVSLKADGTFAAVRRDVALRGQWRFYDRLVSAMVAVPSETVSGARTPRMSSRSRKE